MAAWTIFGCHMHKIDPSFSLKRGEALRERRRRRIVGAIALLMIACLVVGGGLWFMALPEPEAPTELSDDIQMAQVEDESASATPAFQSDIIDLAGDPLRINGLDEDGQRKTKLKYYLAPRILRRFGVTGKIGFFHESILPSGSDLMVTLPSSQRDFAFYQSQKTDSDEATKSVSDLKAGIEEDHSEPEGTQVDATPDAAENALADEEASDLAGTDEQWRRGTIENNVSSGVLVEETVRVPEIVDRFLQVEGSDLELARFLVEHNVNQVVAGMASDAMRNSYNVSKLSAGWIVGLRFQQSGGLVTRRRLVQLAIYAPQKYIGAVALSSDSAGFIDAADPWIDKDLTSFQESDTNTSSSQRYRLIDGIYSAAIRNGVESRIAGEAIMQLSRHFDLAEFATESDKITLVFSVKPREFDGSETNIMYVAIERKDKVMRCFVTRREQTKDFGCYDEEKSSSVPLLSGEMYKPVEGVMTSTFGMRKHPILKEMIAHKGVDWAAPIGSPIRAAYDGRVAFFGAMGPAGNVVRLEHPKSRATRYLHLSGFATGLKVGMQVRAGDLIGYVGTTGRSTGPHLHFELLVNNEAVDPLQQRVADSGSTEAVNTLVNMIIKVESGGNRHAKNPKSTATGLGQFIESTWINMMKVYRPNLVEKYSREELLSLRTDPTLATEMTANLARENEDYLRRRGHAISAARLYLAHFLGRDDADKILSSPDDADVAKIVAPGVIKANDFLIGWTVKDINSWTEKLMSKRSHREKVEEKPKEMPQELPAEYKEYKRHLDRIVELATSAVQ
jgi:murein DD-endopeptidase MepM/ murein hydrolase activator NlpD